MNIAIFEDNKDDLNLFLNLLKNYQNKHGKQINVSVFESENDNLLKYFAAKSYDCIFLDIYEKNRPIGIRLAEQIREIDEDVKIIFTTTSSDYFGEAFSLEAAHYLLKPLDETKIDEAMHRLRDILKAEEKIIVFPGGKNIKEIKIAEKDIYYIETIRNGIKVHLQSEDFSFRYPISAVEKQLSSEKFLRCHQAYIVNLEKATLVDEENFFLINGSKVLIRQKGKGKIKDIYYSYILNKLRGDDE